ncbi:Clp protease N-terminal domain-containing protein [Actinoplanes aureus]|uniref:Clp protease N-terminal domain-containing protein n=1 Tax=Actinoplanes aureus TaxID=2792083 RepID=A0A931C725_9ACTN|nr:Clp protease N-terminal domain-containing protein [Actinoplanes aureus]MBG0563389.1 Clp protease N-terminal domain-containing protein [Actinoplanes aureus]
MSHGPDLPDRFADLVTEVHHFAGTANPGGLLAAAAAIGTQQLLAGLLTEGVAAAILERLSVHAEQIRAASHRLFGPYSEAPGDDVPPMSTEATCAIDTAAQNAAGTLPPEIRTEHLLAVLALDPGSRALNELHVDIAALERELHCYISPIPVRPARWWKRRLASRTCSFCGRATEPDMLVTDLASPSATRASSSPPTASPRGQLANRPPKRCRREHNSSTRQGTADACRRSSYCFPHRAPRKRGAGRSRSACRRPPAGCS